MAMLNNQRVFSPGEFSTSHFHLCQQNRFWVNTTRRRHKLRTSMDWRMEWRLRQFPNDASNCRKKNEEFGQGSFYMRPLVISCCPIGFGMCSSYGIPMGDPVEWETRVSHWMIFSLLKWPRCWGPYGEYFISHIDILDVVAWILDHWAELMKAVES